MSVSGRLRLLEEIEKDVVKMVKAAGQCLQELSKEPTSPLVTEHTTTFLATLQSVDQRLSEQLNYLSQVTTSQWHGDSTYLAEREFWLTCQRTELVQQELRKLSDLIRKGELERNENCETIDPSENIQPMDTTDSLTV